MSTSSASNGEDAEPPAIADLQVLTEAPRDGGNEYGQVRWVLVLGRKRNRNTAAA
jgi:hypothetical protein